MRAISLSIARLLDYFVCALAILKCNKTAAMAAYFDGRSSCKICCNFDSGARGARELQ